MRGRQQQPLRGRGTAHRIADRGRRVAEAEDADERATGEMDTDEVDLSFLDQITSPAASPSQQAVAGASAAGMSAFDSFMARQLARPSQAGSSAGAGFDDVAPLAADTSDFSLSPASLSGSVMAGGSGGVGIDPFLRPATPRQERDDDLDSVISADLFRGEGHSCATCGKVFKHKYRLSEHERVHTGVQPYSCKNCGKTFSLSQGLRGHQKRIHSGDKPYSCKSCDKAFSTTEGLRKHQLVHTGVKAHSCQYCDKSFKTSTGRHDHERTHMGARPYSCESCDKSFKSRGALHGHKHIHTGTKPHSCQYCDKSFISSTKRKFHERIHTGEKPYSCEVCDQQFRRADQVLEHKKKVHVPRVGMPLPQRWNWFNPFLPAMPPTPGGLEADNSLLPDEFLSPRPDDAPDRDPDGEEK